jgi:hypothetical protein
MISTLDDDDDDAGYAPLKRLILRAAQILSTD